VLVEKLLLVFGSEVTVVRDTNVVIVRNEVEDVFFDLITSSTDNSSMRMARR